MAILLEISKHYGVNLNTSPYFERGMAAPPTDLACAGKIILVGALHMCRTGKYLSECVSLVYLGFRLKKDKIAMLEKELV
jgi:hypothetical protein